MDAVKGVMLTNSICFVPAVLSEFSIVTRAYSMFTISIDDLAQILWAAPWNKDANYLLPLAIYWPF